MELTFTDNIETKLNQLAEAKGVDVKEYCMDVLTDHVMLQFYDDMNVLYQNIQSDTQIEKNDANLIQKPNASVEKKVVKEEKSNLEPILHVKRKLK